MTPLPSPPPLIMNLVAGSTVCRTTNFMINRVEAAEK